MAIAHQKFISRSAAAAAAVNAYSRSEFGQLSSAKTYYDDDDDGFFHFMRCTDGCLDGSAFMRRGVHVNCGFLVQTTRCNSKCNIYFRVLFFSFSFGRQSRSLIILYFIINL